MTYYMTGSKAWAEIGQGLKFIPIVYNFLLLEEKKLSLNRKF